MNGNGGKNKNKQNKKTKYRVKRKRRAGRFDNIQCEIYDITYYECNKDNAKSNRSSKQTPNEI